MKLMSVFTTKKDTPEVAPVQLEVAFTRKEGAVVVPHYFRDEGRGFEYGQGNAGNTMKPLSNFAYGVNRS